MLLPHLGGGGGGMCNLSCYLSAGKLANFFLSTHCYVLLYQNLSALAEFSILIQRNVRLLYAHVANDTVCSFNLMQGSC